MKTKTNLERLIVELTTVKASKWESDKKYYTAASDRYSRSKNTLKIEGYSIVLKGIKETRYALRESYPDEEGGFHHWDTVEYGYLNIRKEDGKGNNYSLLNLKYYINSDISSVKELLIDAYYEVKPDDEGYRMHPRKKIDNENFKKIMNGIKKIKYGRKKTHHNREWVYGGY